jgi:hypothetical protein
MYYMWSRFGMIPSAFHALSPGDKRMIKVFYEYRVDEVESMMNKDVKPTYLL